MAGRMESVPCVLSGLAGPELDILVAAVVTEGLEFGL